MRRIKEMFDKLESFFKKRTLLFFLLALLIFVLLVISRRPDAVLNPGFWAEDGVFWYSEAYQAKNPIDPFLLPKQGYYQTISRVGGYVSQFFDISNAPTVFNWIAIFVQILPALLFLSKRYEKMVNSMLGRFGIGLLYIGLLGTSEIHANLTNAQWHLALVIFLILIAESRKQWWWNAFDFIFILIAGLSGPFVLVLSPLMLLYTFGTRLKGKILRLSALFLTFILQLHSILFIVSDATRSKEELHATFLNFFKIISGNVFLRAIIGPDYMKKVRSLDLWSNGFMPVVIGVIGIAILLYVFWKSNREMKFFIVYSYAVFAAGLASPMVSLVKPQWDMMTGGTGGRYYFLPGFAWIVSLVWLLCNIRIRKMQIAICIIFCIYLFVGLKKDWVFDHYKDYHFKQQVSEFKNIETGSPYTFRINPKWEMTLVKK